VNPYRNSSGPRPDAGSLIFSKRALHEDGVSRVHSSTTQAPSNRHSTSAAGSETGDDSVLVPSRKRRRITSATDIEGDYLKRLDEEETRSQNTIQPDRRSASFIKEMEQRTLADQTGTLGARETDQAPQHESLYSLRADDSEKSERTVFLGNVSVEAIKSKSARKVLLSHLSSCMPDLKSMDAPHKVESLRFRSTAFASSAGPKRAAYAKKELMEETTHSTHAYVVYASQAAAKQAARSLNGTIVLDRHLRTDLVTHPAEICHRRCVFVGNLGFVDEEMVETEAESGRIERTRRAKHPADAEEGLWRTFGKAGQIESVRVIRDRSTRVGKGIAYVQFHDENSVEAALMYTDKKFPPLLPRKLRVTRARKPRMALKSASRDQIRGMHPQKANGVKNFTKIRGSLATNGDRSRQSGGDAAFVFEGHRAAKPTAHMAAAGQKKRKHRIKPATRSSRRGASFKAAGGKPQRQ
jgi:nucleolar protein 12